jgi:hypothetical protein
MKTKWVWHAVQLGWASSWLLVCLLASALGTNPAYAGGVVGAGTSEARLAALERAVGQGQPAERWGGGQ